MKIFYRNFIEKLTSLSTSKSLLTNQHVHQMTETTRTKTTFQTLNFDNLALRTLPIDPITENYVRQVKNAIFSKVKPTPLKNVRMVVYSEKAMQLLDLDKEELEVKFDKNIILFSF